jgi:hypothetical protein
MCGRPRVRYVDRRVTAVPQPRSWKNVIWESQLCLAGEATRPPSAKGSAALDVYFQDHPELMRGATSHAGDFATQMVATAEMVTRAVQPVAQRFEVEIDAQQWLVTR